MSGFGGAVKLTGESEYRKALQQITQNLRELASESKVVTSSFGANDKSTEALSAKSQMLTKTLAEQANKLEVLKAQYASMSNQQAEQTAKHQQLVNSYNQEKAKLDELGRTVGTTSQAYQDQKAKVEDMAQEVRKSTQAQDANEKSMSKMRIEINNAQADCNATARAIDELGKETEETGKQAENAGEGYTVFKGIVANLASSAITAAVSGLKKLASSVVSVGKQAYYSYANYEQLVGGVETLFGKSSDKLIKYANEAYKTAGVSANQYMEQATSFSATLLQGLGGDTEKAVEYANMAIIDMSDNANKMGTDMTMIQNAYQGFAKDNYTMLDNLKLGYGGTAGEMARLINDSGVLGDAIEVTAKTVKDVPFDKVIEAVHKTQQQIGITGTTSLEAAQTIEGSTKSVKAAWENLLTGVANENADLHDLIKNLMDNIIIMAKNSVPRIKQVVSGLGTAAKTVLKEFAPDVAKTILPTIEKIIKAVKDVTTFIINNFSTIAPIILGVATAFTVWNASMAVAGTIRAATTALSGLEAGVGLVTKAQTIWNAVMNANPIGIVITAVALLTAGVIALAGAMDDTDESFKQTTAEIEAQGERIDRNVESWENLKDTQQKAVDAGMSEISYYENLVDELDELVDENGKVKEGYEERASFITDKLSDAYGIEIDQVDGVIQNYQTLRSEINKVMEAKKAQVILDSQESLYKEAINGQTDALYELRDAEETLKKVKADRNAKDAELADLQTQLDERLKESSLGYQDVVVQNLVKEIGAIQRGKAEREQAVADAQANYDKQKNLLSEYTYNIGQYEKNMQLAHEGRYSEMSTINWQYVQDYEDAVDAEKAKLEDQVANTEVLLDELKEQKRKSGSDIYDEQIRAAEKQLEQQKSDLKKYNEATKAGLDTVKITWSDSLDDQLSMITGDTWEFKDAGDGLVQAFKNGVAIGEPKTKEEMATLVSNTVAEIDKHKETAKASGENLLDGLLEGIKNPTKQSGIFSTLFNFGSMALRTLQSSMQEQSPSKATRQMGEYLLEGLSKGIENEEGSTLKKVGSFGQDVISTLNAELAQGADIGEISASSGINNVAANGENSMLSAFKEALSQMKIELDDEVAGQFVDKTVSRVIYA